MSGTVKPMPYGEAPAPSYPAGTAGPSYPAAGYPAAGYPATAGPTYPTGPAYPAAYPPPYSADGAYAQQQMQPVQQQQPGFYQYNQPMTGAAVVVQPTVVVAGGQPLFRQSPVWMICPHCQNNVQTKVYYKVGGFTFLIAAALFIFGLSFGCCLIPFCMDSCKDAEHICPSCSRMVGKFHRL